MLEVGDLVLDLDRAEAARAGRSVALYPACRKLLELLMRASPNTVSRADMEHALWGDSPPDADLLRSHVYELRRAIDGPFATKLLHTVPKLGYRLGGDAPATTLVHELGHLFGLDHDFGQQNLMCSCRVGPQQVFTRAQGVEIRRGAAQFVSRIRG